MDTIFPAAVYLLCFATSCLCAWLLARAYWRSGARLLFWSALCFLLLAGNNLFTVIDLLIIHDIDFRMWRTGFALAAVAVLLFGFVWDVEE